MWAALFGFGLSVAFVLAMFSPVSGMKRAALVLGLNFVGVIACQQAVGEFAPWLAFFLLDLICLVAVMRTPATRTHAIIGSVYMVQLTSHLAFAASGQAEATRLYLDLLAFGGWIQIAALTWGAIGGGRNVYAGGDRLDSNPIFKNSGHYPSVGD